MRRALIAFSLLVAAQASAQEVARAAPAEAASRAARVAVDFAPPATGPRWFTDALGQLVTRELGRFHELTITPPLPPSRCPSHASACLVDAYRDAGVDFVILGSVGKEALDYGVHETWSNTRAYGGKLALAGATTATLQRHIGDLVRPIVQRGGLLDQRPRLNTQQDVANSTPPIVDARGVPLLPLVLGALAVFVALPPLLAALLIRRRELRKRARPRSWKWSAALFATLAGLAALAMLAEWRGAGFAMPTAMTRTLATALPILAGALWGAWVLVNATWVFAPIHGLGQIRHDALWPLLRSWVVLTLLRATLLFAHVPLVLLVLNVSHRLHLPERATLAIVLPATGLVVYFWLLTLVDNLATFLDVQLVIGAASERNPWHGTIKRYLRGYLRRNGVQVDRAGFDRVLFLPSLLPDVISYGGGFARPRVLVGEAAREATFGGLPDEGEFPERTINPEELPLGLLIPQPLTNREPPARVEQQRRALTHAQARGRAPLPRVIGEAATLLGWVLPQPRADGVPLIANTTEDFEVVKRLLTEHYAAFERDLDDDDVDDTDPSQKDFLFGALIRQLGAIARQDSLLATLYFSLALAPSRVARALTRLPIEVYERLLAGPAARVADAYAALNHGLHHLIQYLSFRKDGDESRLTARADMPRLLQTSRDLLDRFDGERRNADEKLSLRAHPRNRALWLARFFFPQLHEQHRLRRALGLLTLMTIAAVGISIGVRRAIAYHPGYVERMRIEAAQSESKE